MLVIHVASSRDGVNVMIDGTQWRGEGNHYFAPARGNVREYIGRCVRRAIADEARRGQYCRGARLPNGVTYWSHTDDGQGLGAWALGIEGQWVTEYGDDGRWSRMHMTGDYVVNEARGDRGAYVVTVNVAGARDSEPVTR